MKTLALPTAVLILFAAVIVPARAISDNWPAFRGEDANAVAADDPRLPITWSTTENVAWKTEIPGLGWSSPVVWDDLVFVTSVTSDGEIDEPRMGLYFPYGSPDAGGRPFKEGDLKQRERDIHHWWVYALDFATGEVLWKTEVNQEAPQFDRHLKNTYASETPVTDGRRVYAYFGNVGVFALDLEGGVLWERRWDAAATRMGWGTAASPVLHGDTLFVVNDNDDQSFVAALDVATGEEKWRADRDEGSNWATPFVWENELRTELVTAGSDAVRSYDLEGNLLWHFRGLNSIAIPQPFSAHGLLYVTSGYVGDRVKPAFAIRPGASGDITLAEGETSNEYIAWYVDDAGPYHPTPLVVGDHYVTVQDMGSFTVHDALTGEELYFTEQQKKNQEARRRIARGSGGFTASPWSYNGKVFALSETGDTYVLDPARGYETVGTNSLDEVAMSSPAVARGSLFIRTRSHLWRLTNEAAD
ncbi:MAG: PQQ-binding-like beta-propeller repeat protein [Thermoanaerobaculia bacterium]|nr:PQQ-binding-like beta-propeller repeat protein [Thermoanaerobaculia bacterium]